MNDNWQKLRELVTQRRNEMNRQGYLCRVRGDLLAAGNRYGRVEELQMLLDEMDRLEAEGGK